MLGPFFERILFLWSTDKEAGAVTTGYTQRRVTAVPPDVRRRLGPAVMLL